MLDTWHAAITGKRPYRCRSCGSRFWDVDRGLRFSDRELDVALSAMAPDPPDLNQTVLRDVDQPEIDLKQLDFPEPSDAASQQRSDRPTR
jgi:hypothetical protein